MITPSLPFLKSTIMITITLTEDVSMSLDGVNRQLFKKGQVLTSKNNMEERIFKNIAQVGKAKVAGDEPAENKGEKVAPPIQSRRTKRAKKS